MRLKIGSTYQKAVTIIENSKRETLPFLSVEKVEQARPPVPQYHKEPARSRCSDRSHRSPSRRIPASRLRALCTSSGCVSKANQAAFVWNISKSSRCRCIFR